MKDGERERPIEKNGKKEQKEWLDNILPDPHPCTAGNKEEEHIIRLTYHILSVVIRWDLRRLRASCPNRLFFVLFSFHSCRSSFVNLPLQVICQTLTLYSAMHKRNMLHTSTNSCLKFRR